MALSNCSMSSAPDRPPVREREAAAIVLRESLHRVGILLLYQMRAYPSAGQFGLESANHAADRIQVCIDQNLILADPEACQDIVARRPPAKPLSTSSPPASGTFNLTTAKTAFDRRAFAHCSSSRASK